MAQLLLAEQWPDGYYSPTWLWVVCGFALACVTLSVVVRVRKQLRRIAEREQDERRREMADRLGMVQVPKP